MPVVETNIYPYAEKTQGLPVCLRGLGGTAYQGYVKKDTDACWYQILMCMSGTGCLNYEDKSVVIEPGDLFIMPRRFVYEYYPYEKKWEVRWVVFDGNGIEHLLKELELDRPIVFKSPGIKEVNRLFEKMLVAVRADRVNGIFRCSGICYDMLLELHRMLINKRLPGDEIKNEILTPVLAHIESCFSRDLPVSELVELSGVSHQYLGRIFKQTMGSSIEKYIRKRRIWEARQLLLETDTPIMEIAARCGFSEAGYFSTVFKQDQGLSPAEFRRKSRQQLRQHRTTHG